jgi:hypothetical protein
MCDKETKHLDMNEDFPPRSAWVCRWNPAVRFKCMKCGEYNIKKVTPRHYKI